jgi:hypothetical protein
MRKKVCHRLQDMDNWVLVVDGDAASKKQMEVCRQNPVGLQGFIECNKVDNTDASICSAVDYFPAFCNTAQKSCVYGVRDTENTLLALKTLAPLEQTKSKELPRSSS